MPPDNATAMRVLLSLPAVPKMGWVISARPISNTLRKPATGSFAAVMVYGVLRYTIFFCERNKMDGGENQWQSTI